MVVRYLDGRVAKGYSNDFYPTKDRFPLMDHRTGAQIDVQFSELKAVFFVKSFDSDGDLRPRDDIERFGVGRKLLVKFNDGEELIGFSATYGPGRKTFILFPGDPDCNSQKIVITLDATERVDYL